MARTNIKYLKENNLLEAHKHFMRLSEAYIPQFPEEELEEDENQQDQNDPMGQNPMASGQDPMMGGQDPMMGGQDTNDPMMDNGMDMGGGQDPMMDSNPNDSQEDPLNDAEDDENTIDINGLTKAQDKLSVKQNHIGRDLSKVDDRITKLIDTIQGLQDKLDSNNSELESLKAEFEKRNPTQTEKLNLRSLDSYPFNVKPNEYWAQKAKEGGYEAYGDNSEPTTQEYVITNNDVDNPTDDIADTFFKIDDDDIQTLDKLFKL